MGDHWGRKLIFMEIGKVKHAIHAIKSALGEDQLDRPVVKSWPVKPEWRKKFTELEAMADDIAAQKAKMNSRAEGLWSTIKDELNTYEFDYHYNQETQEIEARED